MTTDALALLSSLVLEDGRRWGDAADDHQLADAVAVLDVDGPPYHFLTRARGYSKTGDLGGVAVAVMLEQLPPGSRLYGIAADRDQGRLLVDTIAGYAQRTPGLESALTINAYNVSTRSGTALEILAADEASAWGLRPAFLVVDELAQHASTPGPRRLWEATTSALVKVPGARLVVLSSAGDPAHWSHKILEHAEADTLWRVHAVAGPPPWADPERLAEQRRRLPASVFARLFENVWTASEDRLTSLDDLRACVTLDGPQEPRQGARYVIGVDLGLKSDRTVAAVCHGERAGSDVAVALDRMEVWSGTRAKPVDLGTVEEWLRAAVRLYRPAELVVDPWQALAMIQRLRGSGIRVTEFTFSAQSVGRLAVTLHTAIRDRHLALPDDEALIEELANVRLRETSPGVLRMDHDPDKHDDRATALGLAVHHILEKPRGQGAVFMEAWAKIRERDLAAAAAGIAQVETRRTDRPLPRPRCTQPYWFGVGGAAYCTKCGVTKAQHGAPA